MFPDQMQSRKRVLLDEQIDKQFKKAIIGHDVWTAKDRRLDGLRDGSLLAAVEQQHIDVLVTLDTNLRYQNRLAGRPFAVIVLRAKRSSIQHLLPLVPELLVAIAGVKPGEVQEIG